MKKLTNTDLDLSMNVTADTTAADILAFFRSNTVKGGKKAVEELLEGKRDEVSGFYLIETEEEETVEEAVETVEEAPVEVKPTPKASDADEKPAFSDDEVEAAIKAAQESGMKAVTEKPTEPVKEKTPRAPRAKAEIKAAAPRGKIKPVRKGTKIADGLELLLEGTTKADLAAKGVSDDITDFVNRRVTKRGYGVAIEGETLKLVLPEGVDKITYSGSAA